MSHGSRWLRGYSGLFGESNSSAGITRDHAEKTGIPTTCLLVGIERKPPTAETGKDQEGLERLYDRTGDIATPMAQ